MLDYNTLTGIAWVIASSGAAVFVVLAGAAIIIQVRKAK